MYTFRYELAGKKKKTPKTPAVVDPKIFIIFISVVHFVYFPHFVRCQVQFILGNAVVRTSRQSYQKEPGNLRDFAFLHFCGINTQFEATLLYKSPWQGG
jgi:hypothetical protein